MRIRKAYFKEWYGNECRRVEEFIGYFNQILDQGLDEEKKRELFSLTPKALISPHAGWVYSGFTANLGYRVASNSRGLVERVVVIGPSHRFPFRGISVSLAEEYETPCGNLPIDREFGLELMERFDPLQNLEYVHMEHSTEVQMPFIKHYLNLPVVELIYSQTTGDEVGKLIEFALDRNSLVIISTDLSHYHRLEEAQQIDRNCLDAVLTKDPFKLGRCEACGKIGVEGMLQVARIKGLTPLLLDYRTSADVSGETSQVVGYMSAIFI
ncbi:MAG: AmmeMemoRadiSam system protein B [Campylobacterales bacterium]